MAVLKIRLEGPMQSYGVRGKWDYRDTLNFPTKSAVVGMLGCAFGTPREKLESISSKIKVHIRINKDGRVGEDFQIREYKETERSGEDKFVLHKYFLQDASFTVYVEGEDSYIKECYQALLNPVWVIFLGRKSYTPSQPLITTKEDECVFTDIKDIEHFIEQDSVEDKDVIKKDLLHYYTEDDSGSLILYTEVSNKGQKFYSPVRLKEHLVDFRIMDGEG